MSAKTEARLGLVFTERCNAACRHCAIVAQREGSGADMPLEDAARYIDEFLAASQGADEFHLSLTGGEPTLRLAELAAVISHAKGAGFGTVSLVSNGHWGGGLDAHSTARTLASAGLDVIGFSCDGFHAERIPIESVIGAIEASRAAGIRVWIKCVTDGSSMRLSEVLSRIQDVLFGETFIGQELAYAPQRLGESALPAVAPSAPRAACPPVLTILPNGSAYPCCGVAWSKGLLVGNARAEGVAAMLDRMGVGRLFCALKEKGPSALLESDHPGAASLSARSWVSECHLCGAIFGHPEGEAIVGSSLARWQHSRVTALFEGVLPQESLSADASCPADS